MVDVVPDAVDVESEVGTNTDRYGRPVFQHRGLNQPQVSAWKSIASEILVDDGVRPLPLPGEEPEVLRVVVRAAGEEVLAVCPFVGESEAAKYGL